MRTLFCLAVVLVGGCGDDGANGICIARGAIARCVGPLDGPEIEQETLCNPLSQAGCRVGDKCTWIVDALMPQYVGHIGCTPDGTASVGESCMFGPAGAAGYDNCKRGLVCGDYRGRVGTCKQICDQLGEPPVCDADHVCVVYSGLFSTGNSTPAAAGVCDVACDPLADNDFDGSGSASTRSGSACGSDAHIGCYGYPSFGRAPRTAWSCRADIHADEAQPIGLRHRVQCTEANHCAAIGPTVSVNSCNQGYLPLMRESATTSTAICVALCKPNNCYAGNCGANDDDRLGEAPHRCMEPDRVGTFDTSATGEHCRYIWSFERDDQGNFLRSPSSDSLGVCFDHAKYRYDSDGDNMPDTPYPPCAALPDGFGSGSALGAADLGCVDTTHAHLATGTAPRVRAFDDLRPLSSRLAR